MEGSLANLSLDDVKEDSIHLRVELVDTKKNYDHYLVGLFLTSIVVHFQVMHSTLANVWHPIGGVSISDLENDRFLFIFYFEVDVDRVIWNGSWNFNSHLLVLHRLK